MELRAADVKSRLRDAKARHPLPDHMGGELENAGPRIELLEELVTGLATRLDQLTGELGEFGRSLTRTFQDIDREIKRLRRD